MSDNELVQMVKNRDEKSFEELRRRHLEFVEKFAWNVGFRGDRDDLQQDIWTKVWSKIHTFRGESEFRTWLTRIVYTYVMMAHRQTKKVRLTYSLEEMEERWENGEQDEDTYSGVGTVDQKLAMVLTKIRLTRAFARLPKNYKTCILLNASGVENKEISKMLGLSIPAIKSRTLRGRAMLTEIMQTV